MRFLALINLVCHILGCSSYINFFPKDTEDNKNKLNFEMWNEETFVTLITIKIQQI